MTRWRKSMPVPTVRNVSMSPLPSSKNPGVPHEPSCRDTADTARSRFIRQSLNHFRKNPIKQSESAMDGTCFKIQSLGDPFSDTPRSARMLAVERKQLCDPARRSQPIERERAAGGVGLGAGRYPLNAHAIFDDAGGVASDVGGARWHGELRIHRPARHAAGRGQCQRNHHRAVRLNAPYGQSVASWGAARNGPEYTGV